MCLQICTHAHVEGGEEEEEDAGEDAWKERCSEGGHYLKGTVLSLEGETVITALFSHNGLLHLLGQLLEALDSCPHRL